MTQRKQSSFMAEAQRGLNLCPFFFVYGTLRRGRGNHHCLSMNDAEFVATTQTVDPMYMAGCGIPFVCTEQTVRESDVADLECLPVRGELFRALNLKTVMQLDWLEGHPLNYKREIVRLESGHVAWIYLHSYAPFIKQSASGYRHPMERVSSVSNENGVYECQ